MIVRWPGRIPAGRTNATPWYFADFMATTAELAGGHAPAHTDGLSVVPALLTGAEMGRDRYLYWEFLERGFEQAVRWGSEWKAVRHGTAQPLELYDLSTDLGESQDVAPQQPDSITRVKTYLTTARTESENWPDRLVDPSKRMGRDDSTVK